MIGVTTTCRTVLRGAALGRLGSSAVEDYPVPADGSSAALHCLLGFATLLANVQKTWHKLGNPKAQLKSQPSSADRDSRRALQLA